ncbi:hypothetical protein ACFU8Q_34195, partial [Streptomyces sp. NPDC057543]|uniref:hypothetical protein n=1 Tax=Streptomyces sp. NPDC057543 TaxID=3346163 RepID=UPI0036ACFC9C
MPFSPRQEFSARTPGWAPPQPEPGEQSECGFRHRCRRRSRIGNRITNLNAIAYRNDGGCGFGRRTGIERRGGFGDRTGRSGFSLGNELFPNSEFRVNTDSWLDTGFTITTEFGLNTAFDPGAAFGFRSLLILDLRSAIAPGAGAKAPLVARTRSRTGLPRVVQLHDQADAPPQHLVRFVG